MDDCGKFGSPILIKKLDIAYREEKQIGKIEPRESDDISSFLKEKEKKEKESRKMKIIFK